MFKIVGIILLGVFLGILFRRKLNLKVISKTMTWIIYLLLLILGIAVGGNETIMRNLGTIGVKAIIIALAATLGSMICARILYHKMYKKKQ